MQVSKCELDGDLLASPEPCHDKLFFAFFEVLWEQLFNFLLRFFVNYWHELLIKLPTTHGASGIDFEHLLLA